MKKKTRNILTVIAIIGIIFSAYLMLSPLFKSNNEEVGGQTDSHGCLYPAGYTWNESLGFCLREWEINDSQRQAAQIAISQLNYSVTITDVEIIKCQGCFNVKIQRNDNRESSEVELTSWSPSIQKIYCTEAQKSAEVCDEIYSPVCGWFNKSINCFKYSCAQNFGNSCFACASPSVEYYTLEDCPTSL